MKLDALNINVDDRGDAFFISTCEGIDHESWGNTVEEARSNFIKSLSWMKVVNGSDSFANLFSDKSLLDLILDE